MKVGDKVFWVCRCRKPHISVAKILQVCEGFCKLDKILPTLRPEEMDYAPNYKSGSVIVNTRDLFSTPEAAFDDYKGRQIQEAFRRYNEDIKDVITKAENRIKKAQTLTMLPIDKYES